MKFSRNVKTEVGIDLTSLIDVVFILLLFFILTTTFTREHDPHHVARGQCRGNHPVAAADRNHGRAATATTRVNGRTLGAE